MSDVVKIYNDFDGRIEADVVICYGNINGNVEVKKGNVISIGGNFTGNVFTERAIRIPDKVIPKSCRNCRFCEVKMSPDSWSCIKPKYFCRLLDKDVTKHHLIRAKTCFYYYREEGFLEN